MAEQNANQDSLISDSLHPLVNMAIIGLVLMFVAAVWMFFDSDTYEAWLDVVITGLFVIAIAIPALCWLTWRRNADGARDEGHPSFRDWAAGEFKTWTGPVKGGQRDRRSPAADRCSRRRNDGPRVGVPHHRERRRLILQRQGPPASLDHLVGAGEQSGRHLEAGTPPVGGDLTATISSSRPKKRLALDGREHSGRAI